MKIVLHEAMSFPRDGREFGWVDGFNGYALDGERKAAEIIAHAGECGVDKVLLRGYVGCADRHSKWPCGYKADGTIMRTGVYTPWASQLLLDHDDGEHRRRLVGRLREAGLEVRVHIGPATGETDAVLSGYLLARDGVDAAVIDSSGNNLSEWVKLQKRELADRGVGVFDEPVGDGNEMSLARVESDHFPWEAIEQGRVRAAAVCGWWNNPKKTAAEPAVWMARCIRAGLAEVVVPYRVLRAMRASKGSGA